MDLQTRLKYQSFIWFFTRVKVPLLGYANPQVVELNDNQAILKIALSRKTKNHLNSMYFGAICMGAEACVGIKVAQLIFTKKYPVDFVFKDFKIQFLKRPEDDVNFYCDQGQGVEALLKKALASGERETQTFQGYAALTANPSEKVAEFEVSLSLKMRKKK